jgi:hypothetical protein
MKTIPLKVGAKGTRPAIKVPTQVAETLEDLSTLARGSVEVIVRWANRGKRIEDQDASGARAAFKEGKSEDEIAALVANYDPTVKKERKRTGTSGPRTKKVKLDETQIASIPEHLRELLKSKGVVIEAAAPEQPTSAG